MVVASVSTSHCHDRLQEHFQIVEVAAHPNNDMIAHDERRFRGPVAFLDVRDLSHPEDLAGLGIQRDQVGVGAHEKDAVLVNGNAALADVVAFVGRVLVVPELMAGARVDRPDIVRHGEVQDAVDQDRRRLDAGVLSGLKGPGQAEIADVGGGDLGERAVAPSGVIPMKARPAIGRRMQEQLVVDVLRLRGGHRGCGEKDCAEGEEDCGFRELHACMTLNGFA